MAPRSIVEAGTDNPSLSACMAASGFVFNNRVKTKLLSVRSGWMKVDRHNGGAQSFGNKRGIALLFIGNTLNAVIMSVDLQWILTKVHLSPLI